MQTYPPATGILEYARHFLLLAGMATALVATSRWNPVQGAVASFGLYGALHSFAVAMTLRDLLPPWRKPLFVAMSASLSMVSVVLGLYASHRLAGRMGMVGAAAVLALSSGFGATSYAILIRQYLGADLSLRGLAAITAGCVLATLVVFWTGGYSQPSGVWFAAYWWFAFSMGLWHCDRRRAPR